MTPCSAGVTADCCHGCCCCCICWCWQGWMFQGRERTSAHELANNCCTAPRRGNMASDDHGTISRGAKPAPPGVMGMFRSFFPHCGAFSCHIRGQFPPQSVPQPGLSRSTGWEDATHKKSSPASLSRLPVGLLLLTELLLAERRWLLLRALLAELLPVTLRLAHRRRSRVQCRIAKISDAPLFTGRGSGERRPLKVE